MSDEKATSPLAEAKVTSLDELFSAAPLDRTIDEWKLVVATLRDQRERWAAEEAAGKRRSSAAKAPKPTVNLDEINLFDD